ncbi:adhesion G protein-coupled receptor E5 isoform X2 [Syngnathus scovelli]|uniref:adhesion G protein-coupled receptor E5 isoform X2 n=1 Tax=Syngnathus scovelli TaxID=161590 RepID=UPI0021108907|nr:adhesion G protein-coupled receptor E2 isoform X2 [Syngnathus scovelli]
MGTQVLPHKLLCQKLLLSKDKRSKDCFSLVTMEGRWKLLLLALCLSSILALSESSCPQGFALVEGECNDVNECEPDEDYPKNTKPCGNHAHCYNTIGSSYCTCDAGYQTDIKTTNFTNPSTLTCRDINECWENKDICGSRPCINTDPMYHCGCNQGFVPNVNSGCDDVNECLEENICGPNAMCINTVGSHNCVCKAGFATKSGEVPQDPCEAVCSVDETNHCGNGTCHIGASGAYCTCHTGFTNYKIIAARCTELDCDAFKEAENLEENLTMLLKKSCVALAKGAESEDLDDQKLLLKLLEVIDHLLSTGALNNTRKVSIFLDLVESALRLVGPLVRDSRINKSSPYTELDLLSLKGPKAPRGVQILRTKLVKLQIYLETVSGDASQYPGFASVSLLSYVNLETFTDAFSSGMNPEANERFIINSKVATVSVTNTNTSPLEKPVMLTFSHLTQVNGYRHECVFWNTSQGSWSTDGCKAVKSNSEVTVCSCNHLSTFAVLMALYDVEATFELQMVTWVGLSLSLICLLICILTFSLIRSIQSPRTTIHLHLCISLFVAAFIFLVGISRTENQTTCAVIAGFLHFFFLAAFCWMCLEGVQLFRMVIFVFNTNFPTVYMMLGGYGVPAVIVVISAMVNHKGYGTQRYCWLNVDFIWSFLGPACVIIAINIFFFLITVWKLAQKFSSLNPDLNTLQKIKAFTITAVAQLCVLGTTWIFGCFQFEESTMVMSYLFTIFASLQGLMLFVMHCLFSKQVRDEYGNLLSRFSGPPKKRYTEFSSFPSRQHASNSSQNTGESHI